MFSLLYFIIFADEAKGRSNSPSSVLFKAVRDAIEETMLRPLVLCFFFEMKKNSTELMF